MTREIRLYVEGGGDGKETRARLRRGFSGFFRELEQHARTRRIRWDIIACGSRDQAFKNFKRAMRTNPHAFNVLIVDAETSVSQPVWSHLHKQDGWELGATNDDYCHVMVEVMEAWLIADLDALAKFYGRGFKRNVIPKSHNVESIDKEQVIASLKVATRQSSKGEYHKINHGPTVLGLVNSATVCSRARHCNRLFATLRAKIEE